MSVLRRRVRLGEVLRLRKEIIHPHDKPEGRATFVGLEHLESGTGRRTGSHEIDLTSLTGRKPKFYNGDIVYGYLRPYLNKVWIAEFDGLCSVDQYVYEVDRSMADPEYIVWFMRSPRYLLSAPVSAGPGQLPRIRLEEVAAVELDLPDLGDQRRMISTLRDQLSAVERAGAAARAQLDAANGLAAAHRRDVFSTPGATSWLRRRLGDLLAQPIKTGISKPLSLAADKRCLTLSAVRDGLLDLSASKPVAVGEAEAEGNWVTPGAFYVVRGNGQLRLVGRGALAPAVVDAPALYPDLLFQVVTDPEQVDSLYLRFVWETDAVRADIEQRARTSAGIFKINQANLRDTALPLPPLEEQRRIARTLAGHMRSSKRLRETVQARLTDIESLPTALLRRAFSGEP